MDGIERRAFLRNAAGALVTGAALAGRGGRAQSDGGGGDRDNVDDNEKSLENRGPRVLTPYRTYVVNDLVSRNTFIRMPRQDEPLPAFEESKAMLPEPFWAGHPSAIDCYWKAWQIAFSNLRRPTPESGFPANYIDTAFNDCIFMWDTCFILMFGRYGARAFSFLRTLDNFYAKQHPDGFICREIGQQLGDDRFFRFDPTSTGPNVMAWTEWEYYLNFGDRERLERVFPVLAAYHQWLRAYRTWRDGSYWASGWACGMDNQPRLDPGKPYHHDAFYHQHMVWADTCLQQILSARLIARMAKELEREDDAADMIDEAAKLTNYVNEYLWDEGSGYYYDRRRDGSLNGVKSIGAFWALLADAVAESRRSRFIAHLSDPEQFNRPHRVPTLSADDPHYEAGGGYWRGSVWPPTNYMVLRGLSRAERDDLAYEIARNHIDNVVRVFEKTGSVFENYAPESADPGSPARKDFVGWGGVPPIAVLLEYVIGLQPDVPKSKLVWRVNLLEKHGVRRYPFGAEGWLDLKCRARSSETEQPRIEATTTVPVDLDVRWKGKSTTLHLRPE